MNIEVEENRRRRDCARRNVASRVLIVVGAVACVGFGSVFVLLALFLPGRPLTVAALCLALAIVAAVGTGYAAGAWLLCSSVEKARALSYGAMSPLGREAQGDAGNLLRGSSNAPPAWTLLRTAHDPSVTSHSELLRSDPTLSEAPEQSLRR